TEILLHPDRAVAGVRLADGRKLAAQQVVVASDSSELYSHMLPASVVPPRITRALAHSIDYPSSFSLFLGLDCSPETFGLGEEVLNLTRPGIPRADHSSGDPRRTLITVLAPSVRDPSLAPPGKGTVFIQCPARMQDHQRWHTGENLSRGPEYRAWKAEFADILLDRIEAAVPGLRSHIEIREAATPVTYWRYTRNRDGRISGARPLRRNIRSGVAHYQTAVPGLFLAGQSAEYGGGVPMAVRSGANAALLVLRRRRPEVFRELLHRLRNAT
ncbi:MAG: FAD-dependent oxidoreductase, partial [Kiritimatiellia bacterium]|nr:FAD-dependent oxidoreductase [Kiritimatiellia bacterium]